MKILFVCTGNTCRSPMAQYIAKNRAKIMGVEKLIKFDSAGLIGPSNMTITLGAKTALKEKGIKCPNHKSKIIDFNKIDKYKFIITMTKSIKQNINKPNCFSIFDFCGFEIPDPYMQNQNVYNYTANQIEKAVDIILSRILKKEQK